MEAFIPAAGLGTRLKPITDSIPKALLEINGITLLEIVLKRLALYSFDTFVINIHHFGGQIIEFLESRNNFELNIKISDERHKLLDTGGGLKQALNYLKEENFLIHNVDILTDLNPTGLMTYHLENEAIVTLAVQERESSRYFLFDDDKILCGWENVKTGEKKIVRSHGGVLKRFAFSGIHAVSGEIRTMMPPQDVFSVIDFYLSIAAKHQITYFNHSNTKFIDLGKKGNIADAENLLNYI